MEQDSVADILVIDSAGFIKNSPLHQYGQELVTLRDVISEIKDKATKQRLLALPYELQYKEPDAHSLQKVSEFSKKTGDFGSLSLTDLKVLALTYMLESQIVGTEHLNDTPTIKPTVEVTHPKKSNPQDADGKKKESNPLVGFVHPDDEMDEDTTEVNESKLDEPEESLPETVEGEWEEYSGSENEGEEEEDDDDDDDDEGWITPKNFAQKRLEMFGTDATKERKKVKVACLTTDFAMQNVLLQMGLNVVSVDGVVIHETKTWIKRCYACFKVVPDVSKEFCPKCGNKTLKRVSVTLNADGSMKIHISGRRQLTGRGKKYSLPAPKGGKHAFNPILCADQPVPQQHLSKTARAKLNAMDPDFIAGNSPFSLKDVTSKSAMINVTGQHKYWMKRNPNEVGRKTGNRKKNS